MSRAVLGRYVLTGTLTSTTALSIGHGDEGTDDDIRCVRDGRGRLVIPGSALAGVVRRVAQSVHWGSQDAASSVWCEDSVAKGEVATEHRDGVGINRHTGAADPGVLYRREVVPAGTTFALRVEVERRDQTDDALELAQAIANELKHGRSFGGGTTRGLGAAQLTTSTLTYEAWDTCQRMVDRLLGRPGQGQPSGTEAAPANVVTLTVPWRPVGPLLVSVAVNGLVDRMPQTTGSGNKVRLVVPGSSIKGAMRSRAERIMRTLLAAGPCPEDLLGQASEPLAAIAVLFGLPPRRKATRSGALGTDGESPAGTAPRHDGRMGAVMVNEPRSPIVTDWATIVDRLADVAPANPSSDERHRERRRRRSAARRRLSSTALRFFDHVAIDRWTGGADDGKLFATVAPIPHDGFPWEPITLRVDVARLAAGARPQDQQIVVLGALTLLVLLVRDLADGYLGIGHGVTRGYGEISADLTDMTIVVGHEVGFGLGDLNGRTVEELLAGAPGLENIKKAMEDAWAALLRLDQSEAPGDLAAVAAGPSAGGQLSDAQPSTGGPA